MCQSIAAYRLSIALMGPTTRLLLILSACLPLVPYLLVASDSMSRVNATATLVAMVIAAVLVIPIHEAMHGLVFWSYTHRVSYGFKPWSSFGPVFYAASVGSRFSPRQYQPACIAPQLVTILTAIVGALHPADVVVVGAWYAAAINIGAGAVDIFVAARLFTFPSDSVVEDAADGLEVYLTGGN